MAITFIISGSNGSTDSNVASFTINTSGANFIVVVVGAYGSAAAPALTDNKGNTGNYIPLTEQANTTTRFQMYYCESPAVGSGHTFTATQAGSYPAIAAMCFSGVASASALKHQVGSLDPFADPTIKAGSIDADTAGDLIVTGMTSSVGATIPPYTVDSGFTPAEVIDHAGNTFGCAAAYKFVTGTVDPEWTIGGGNNGATNASFAQGSSDILHPASVM